MRSGCSLLRPTADERLLGRSALAAATAAIGLLGGCRTSTAASGASTASDVPPPDSSVLHGAPAAPQAASGPAPHATAAFHAGASATAGLPCGALGCRWFDSPQQALAEILKTSPRVLAFGETHAQRDSEGVASATSRFTQQLLPMLRGRASDIVLELIVADGTCGKKTEEKVAEQQRPVVEPQRATNQNEFFTLGTHAKNLGIRPHVLRPSCADYEHIAHAGEEGVPTMLKLIADETTRLIRAILDRNQREATPAVVLAYGGAMHNDLVPRPGMETWSYAARVAHLVEGQYAEIDIIVPEFIRNTEVWRALPWYAHFDPAANPHKVTLFEPSPRSYVLVFAASTSR